jgi:hypothetical protein
VDQHIAVALQLKRELSDYMKDMSKLRSLLLGEGDDETETPDPFSAV